MTEDRRQNDGFTLVETLVVVSVFIFVSLSLFSFLLTTIIGTSRAAITKEIKQNGSYALSVMESLIVPASEVSCPSSSSVNITPSNGSNPTTISCLPAPDYKIASGSSYLTNEKVKVDSCSFTCSINPGQTMSVDVEFLVSQRQATGLRTAEKDSMTFKTRFVVRNQRE